MSNDVAATWAGIEAWAQRERPELLACVRAPAEATDLAALRDCGLPVPEALLRSLAIHDGEDETADTGLFPHGGLWLSAAEMLERRAMLHEVRESIGGNADQALPTLGPVKSHSFNDLWLPIIDLNGDVVWYLDFDPAPGGQPGQVIRVDQESGEWVVCAPDFASFLAMWHDDLVEGRVFDEDGELRDDKPWPPLALVPALQSGTITEADLHDLGAMGRWDDALALADRLPATPAQRWRLQARVHQYDDDSGPALHALDALAAMGEETTDDLLVRIDVLEQAGKGATAHAALEAALAARPAAALYVRHAALVRAQAEESPKKGRKAEVEWLASPAGQQAIARANEIALADYDAALALEDNIEWRNERICVLLDSQRWEEAEADAAALVARIEADPAAAPPHALDQARIELERAQARGEDDEDGGDMLESMDELLAGFKEMMGGKDSDPLTELKELREALAGLVDQQAQAQAELDAEPDSVRRRARVVADNLARMHADTPERFAPFDAAGLDGAARHWYDGARDALVAQGFELLADVEPVRNTEINGSRVLMRLMLSADRRTVAAVWRVDHPMGAYEVVDLESELDDGRVLITNNAGTANPFTQPDAIETLSLARGTTMSELLAAHLPRLSGQPARTLPDLDAVVDLQERQRVLKREAARARGWVSDSELRSMLGASYRELAPVVREELSARL